MIAGAEFFQQALELTAESITYEGMGERRPVASNATEAGRSRNRRMDVEVWYDEIDEKLVPKLVTVQEHIKRVKVCRVEQMCRISYKAGHSQRTRVKNLIPPFHYEEDNSTVPQEYREKLLRVLNDLGDKLNVTLKFIGHTDDTPLAGRDARIYANHVGISKARARRLALALQEALKLPASTIDSDGKGAADPVASNATPSGRAANRRIEVEFWYDDALKERSSEPQVCPEAAAPQTLTRVYQSPNIVIKPVIYEDGKPVVPPDFALVPPAPGAWISSASLNDAVPTCMACVPVSWPMVIRLKPSLSAAISVALRSSTPSVGPGFPNAAVPILIAAVGSFGCSLSVLVPLTVPAPVKSISSEVTVSALPPAERVPPNTIAAFVSVALNVVAMPIVTLST